MSDPSLAPEVTIWTDGTHATLVSAVLDVMGGELRPIGVGGTREAGVETLAQSLDCPREDDLRKLIVERPAAFLLVTSMAGVAGEDLAAAGGAGSLILSLEPPAQELSALSSKWAPTRLLLLPGFRHSDGFVGAADPNDVLGEPRSLAYESVGKPDAGSLFARLYDAWLTVLAFVALPESVDCSLSGPFNQVPDTLREIGGRLAAHARVADGSSVVLQLADHASDNRRYLHVLGEQAELRITDRGYELRQLTGEVVDRGEVTMGGIGFVDLIAQQWRRLLARPDLLAPTSGGTTGREDASPHRNREALASCQACLLSARTGQPESPRKLLEMNR